VAASGWVPALVLAQRRFPDRLGLALGIVSSGVGLGMLLVVPLCQLLIDAFGWRTAFRTLAALCLACVIPAALYIMRTSPPPSAGTRQTPHIERTEARDRRAVRGWRIASPSLGGATRTLVFWLIMTAWLLGNVCTQTLHVHQVVYLVDHGIAPIVAATVVSVVGAASIVAKIGGGWISDWIDREIVYVAGIGIMVGAVGVLALVGIRPAAWGAYVYAVLLGVGYSVTASVIPAMASDRFSGPHFGAIVGIGLLASALGSAIGPWFAGWLFDRTGSYGAALAIAAGCAAAAGVAAWRLRTLRLQAQASRAAGTDMGGDGGSAARI
jgi:MFS family permease